MPTAPNNPAVPRPHSAYPATRVDVACAQGATIPAEVLTRLESLDDAIFAALNGDAPSLDRAAKLWAEAQVTVRPEWLDESRRQYIRRAETVCSDYQSRPLEKLATTFAALEVLTLLAD